MFRVRVAGDFPFLSTPSARRATERPGVVELARAISIHALREEGDLLVLCKVHHQGDFYPRPPRGGRPLSSSVSLCRASNFYPRPPRGGRPYCAEWYGWRRVNFYPRPPRGGRPTSTDIHPAFRVFLSTPSARRATGPESVDGQNCGISIHALREEGDPDILRDAVY